MASTADFRNGMVIDLEGTAFRIVEFQHVKPGKGGAFVRTKLKNVLTGAVIERTYRSGEKFNEIRLERQDAQYLYFDGDLFHFMDVETYEQFSMSTGQIGEDARFLKENGTVKVLNRDGKPFLIELPPHVVLTVTRTEPGVKGDTATGATKPAELETGLVVSVPLFIEEGDQLKVDTRTGVYLERVSTGSR